MTSNTSDITARLTSFNVTNNSTVDVATPEILTSAAAGNVSNSSATGSRSGGLRQQMAYQFQLVYSAKEAFNVQNLSAEQMFQVNYLTPKVAQVVRVAYRQQQLPSSS